jgi:signal peptidase I
VDRAKLVKEIRGWTLTILAVLAFRTFLYEAVYIPSGSMIPTLQIGDYVIVEKWAYGARLPFTETAQVTWSAPKRGDIVVLLSPPNNPRREDLIKRVVAVGGDTVEVRDGRLVLNGEVMRWEHVAGACSYQNKPEGGEWATQPCVDSLEHLNGHTYHTYCSPYGDCDASFARMEPVKVPEGTVFLVGDHRDSSADSRAFGPVPVGRVKGRAWMALASWGRDGPRWDRLFHLVNH